MAVLDMEGDGRDETALTSYGSSLTEASRPQYTLLRSPSGDGFVAEPVPIPNDQPVWFSSAGESDGAPGDDLLFVHEGLRRLVRVTSRDGALVAEQAPAIDILQPPGNSWIVGAADGLLVISSDRGIGTARWPRDGTLGDVTEQERDAWPTLYLLGTGEDARIVEVTGTDDAAASALGIRVFNLALDLELDIAAPQEMNDLWAASSERVHQRRCPAELLSTDGTDPGRAAGRPCRLPRPGAAAGDPARRRPRGARGCVPGRRRGGRPGRTALGLAGIRVGLVPGRRDLGVDGRPGLRRGRIPR